MKRKLLPILLLSPVLFFSQKIGFKDNYTFAKENDGQANVKLKLSATSAQNVSAEIKIISGGNASSNDTSFVSQVVTIPANSTEVSIDFPINNNSVAEADRFFVLELSNPTNATMDTKKQLLVYINDDDFATPIANQDLDINFLTSYLVDASGSAEISAYDKNSKHLFVLNSTSTKIHVLDFNNPASPSEIRVIDMSSYGDGATSVSVYNGIIAATVLGANKTNGKLILMNANGDILNSLSVGVHPDMVTFSPNGNKILVANEGEPNDDYSIDPEGSISVVDFAGNATSLTQANVTQVNFNSFDSQKSELIAQGVRIFGPNATVSQDLEPEYITISDDEKTAWITLQENNAIATLDLTSNSIVSIKSLGKKDHSIAGNAIDASDKNEKVFMSNWPIKSFYMPDAVAHFSVGNQKYLVTANEGDAREWGSFVEEARIKNLNLDPTIFPASYASILKNDNTIGRLNATTKSGDIDGDGDIDEINVFGGRSFSIWNADNLTQVYDSGDDFERITSADPVFGSIFNASNDNQNYKDRSDNKGPEPEGITTANINGHQYAFITLERIGGIMVYDVSDVNNVKFVAYKNNRSISNATGDLGPEGIIYIKPEDNGRGKGLIVVSNEVSSTVSIYEITNDVLATENIFKNNEIKLYPNPAKDIVYFSKPISGVVYDMSGKSVLKINDTAYSNVENLPSGIYILKTENGESIKLIKK